MVAVIINEPSNGMSYRNSWLYADSEYFQASWRPSHCELWLNNFLFNIILNVPPELVQGYGFCFQTAKEKQKRKKKKKKHSESSVEVLRSTDNSASWCDLVGNQPLRTQFNSVSLKLNMWKHVRHTSYIRKKKKRVQYFKICMLLFRNVALLT